MELRGYLRILSKRAWIILLVAAITAMSAFVFSQIQTPVYRSSIMLNVIPARLDWGLQQTIQGLMRNFAGRIRSRQTASQVIDRLQLDITPTELSSKITVSPVESDFLIRIDADDYDPVIAGRIAQSTAEVFVEEINVWVLQQDQRDRVEVSIRDYAEVGVLHRPKWKVNVLAGSLFGALIGFAIVFLLEWLEADVMRTTEDVERHTGVAVLGLIPALGGSAGRSQAAWRRTLAGRRQAFTSD
jgi:capsular polysaccharide biosynthesis protein